MGKVGATPRRFFYANDGIVTLTYPDWLQGVYDALTGLFEIVGLRKNVRETVGMICCPCWTAGAQLDTPYKRRMTGEGLTCW